MRILGLDLGKRRTGVAFADTGPGFVMALDTIKHTTTEDLIIDLRKIITDKKVETVAIGLPRLPDGSEGEQVNYVRSVAELINTTTHLPIRFIDERYTSYGTTKDNADAKAACSIVEIAMNQLGQMIEKTTDDHQKKGGIHHES